VEQRSCRNPLEHLPQAALVVARLVRRYDEVESSHPRGAQLPVDARLGRSAVEQHRRPRAVLDQRRVALPDVQERDGHVPRRGRLGADLTEAQRERGGRARDGRGSEAPRRAAPARGRRARPWLQAASEPP
jgi:hypothetical protein